MIAPLDFGSRMTFSRLGPEVAVCPTSATRDQAVLMDLVIH